MQKGNLIVAFSKNINLNWKTEIVDWCVKCWIVSFRVTTNIVIYVQYSCQILLTSFSVYKYCLYAHWHKLPIIKFLFYWKQLKFALWYTKACLILIYFPVHFVVDVILSIYIIVMLYVFQHTSDWCISFTRTRINNCG